MNDAESKSSFFEKALTYRSRVAELSIGLTVNKAIDALFNYLLYPSVIYYFGVLRGGIVMTFLSFVACIFSMKFYDWSKRDWLGIESIKDLKTYKGKRKSGRFSAWILSKSDPVIFLFSSVW